MNGLLFCPDCGRTPALRCTDILSYCIDNLRVSCSTCRISVIFVPVCAVCIDSIAKYVGCTRNEIMVKCFELALEHMELSERQDGKDRPQE